MRALLLLLPLLAPSREGADRLLEDAFVKYRAGDYAAASAAYRGAIAAGVDGGEIRYNLGNCEARAGNWAKALVEYRRARAFLPRDDDLAHNLGVVRRRLGFATPAPGLTDAARGLLEAFTRRELVAATLGFDLVFFGLLAWRALRPSRFARAASIAAGLGLLASASLLAHERFVRSNRARAVVLSETGARSEPRTDREELFRLRPGEDVRVLGVEGEWLRVDAKGRGVGWIGASSAERV